MATVISMLYRGLESASKLGHEAVGRLFSFRLAIGQRLQFFITRISPENFSYHDRLFSWKQEIQEKEIRQGKKKKY